MKFLISVLLLFFGVTNFMAQDINCSTTPNFSVKQVEEIKSNILNNTDGNEASRFEDSKSLYCYSKINNDKNLLAFACNQLGLYYYQKRVKEKSFEYLREAENILKENASGDLYRDNLNYLGLLYNFAGQHSMGINYLNKFHQYCLDYSSNKKIADAKNDLGLIYIEVGEYKLAKDYLEQALDTLLKIKDVFGAGYSALNLGRNEFINNNKRGLAIDFANRAIQIWEPENFQQGLFYANNALAEFYADTLSDKSLEFSKITLEIGLENDFKSLGNVYRNLGNAHLKLGNNIKAKEAFKKCLSFAEEHYIRDLFDVSYRNLVEIYTRENNFNGLRDLANLASNYFASQKESNNSADKEWIYITEKNALQNQTISAQNEVIEKKNFANKLLFIITLLSGLIGLIIFYFWRRVKNQHIKLKEANKVIKDINLNLEETNVKLIKSSEVREFKLD